MNKTKKTTRKTEYIAIGDLAHQLGLSEAVVERWIVDNDCQVPLLSDHRGRPSVPSGIIEKLSLHHDYATELRKALLQEERKAEFLSTATEAMQLKKQRTESVENYEDYIKKLSALHRKYINEINAHPFESAPVAAYLLFSRAISLLEQGCFCLKSGYWYTGAILREIDEVVDVAHYLVATENTEEGKRALHGWFRQNKAPKHSVCRRALAKWGAKLNPGTVESEHEMLLNEVYQKKSKWVHPTFSAIREVTKFGVNERVTIVDTDYGVCSREYKLLELTDFFRSSIWTCFQKFLLCFIHGMPLTNEDTNLLLAYDKIFLQWE